jgi:ABC-type sugar transport system permease subunit
MAVVFRYLFDLRGGFVNQLLAVLGIAPSTSSATRDWRCRRRRRSASGGPLRRRAHRGRSAGRHRDRPDDDVVTVGILVLQLLTPALPLFLGISQAGLADSLTALIAPFATSAFGIFLLRQHMVTIPDDLLDAARADGLGTLTTLREVVVPASMPAIATFAVFSTVGGRPWPGSGGVTLPRC